jgi:hypothetical protein
MCKRITIFAFMNKRRNIFLNILLLIIVCFCSGIDFHSNSETHKYYLELSTGSNNFENKLSHHTDTSDEDQMEQSAIVLLPEQPECQKSDLCILPLHNNLFVAVWQPPKVF